MKAARDICALELMAMIHECSIPEASAVQYWQGRCSSLSSTDWLVSGWRDRPGQRRNGATRNSANTNGGSWLGYPEGASRRLK
jgi:hypothetical protein